MRYPTSKNFTVKKLTLQTGQRLVLVKTYYPAFADFQTELDLYKKSKADLTWIRFPQSQVTPSDRLFLSRTDLQKIKSESIFSYLILVNSVIPVGYRIITITKVIFSVESYYDILKSLQCVVTETLKSAKKTSHPGNSFTSSLGNITLTVTK